MKFISCFIYFIAILTSSAYSAQASNLIEFFENICLSTPPSKDNIETSLQSASQHLKLELISVPFEQVRVLSPEAKYAWVIDGKSEPLIFTYTEKKVDNKKSSSCSIYSRQIDQAQKVTSFIETKFRAKKILDRQQGSTHVWAYQIFLAGFPERMNVSVQKKSNSDPNLQLLMVSFFD